MRKGPLLLSALCVIALAPRLSGADETKAKSPLGLDVNALVSSGLQRFSDPDYNASSSLWLMPSYKLSSEFKLGGRLIIDHNLTGDQGTSVEDGLISLSYKGWKLNPFFKLSLGGSAIVPISTASRQEDSLITGLSVGPKLTLDLDHLPIPLHTYYSVSGGRRFYQYPASLSGSSNSEYTILQVVNLEADFTDKLSFSSTYMGSTGVTYASNVTTSFETFQELDYQITKAFGVGAGLSNTGNLLKPNGIDSNFAFYDSHSANIYGSVTYTF